MDELENNGQQDINADNGAQDGTANNPAEFSIPEEYKTKGWTKFFDGKTGEDLKAELFRSYDSSQSLIGKRVEDYLATTDLKRLENFEQIKENLIKQIAPEYETPEEIGGYNLKEVLTNASAELPITDEVMDSMAEKFKELGVSAQQGQQIFKTYLDLTLKDFEKVTDPQELEQNISNMFNGNTEQRKNVENLIKEFLPDEDRKIIQDIVPNVVVEMFYKVAKGFVEKYDYKEGTNNSSNPAKMRMSEADRNAEYNRLYEELQNLDSRPQKPGEKDAIVNRMRELFK